MEASRVFLSLLLVLVVVCFQRGMVASGASVPGPQDSIGEQEGGLHEEEAEEEEEEEKDVNQVDPQSVEEKGEEKKSGLGLLRLGLDYKKHVLEDWRKRDEKRKSLWSRMVENNKLDLKKTANQVKDYIQTYMSGEFGEPSWRDKRDFLFSAVRGDFYACKTYQLKFCEVQGALDCQNERDGMTALAIAAENEDQKLVEFLLARGANPMIKDRFGNTALHYAALSYDEEIADVLLLNGSKVDVRNRMGVTPLMMACEAGDAGMAKLLLEDFNAIPNKRDKIEKWTALHYAAKSGDVETIKVLLKNGCDYSKMSATKRTPQDVALDCEQEEAAMLLVKWRRRELGLIENKFSEAAMEDLDLFGGI